MGLLSLLLVQLLCPGLQQLLWPGLHAHRLVPISTGQQFADAVVNWGVMNDDVELVIEVPYLSMANVTFPQPPVATNTSSAPYSSGELIIRGSPEFERVTLDAAMRPSLTPPLQGATISMENISYVNCCEVQIPNPTHVGGFTVSSISGGGLFRLTLLYRSMLATNVTFYMRLPDIARQVYIGYLTRVTFPALKLLLQPLLEELPRIVTEYESISVYGTKTALLSGAALAGRDIVGQAITDPDDPLLQSMRANGQLMEPVFCSNGSLLPPHIRAARYDKRAPLLLTNTTRDFMQAVAECIDLAAETPASTWRPVPAVVLSGNVSLTPNTLHPLNTLEHAMVIGGPYNDVPRAAIRVVLDLQQGVHVIQMGREGQLFLQHLVLAGLAKQPLPTLPPIITSLPLAAFAPPPPPDWSPNTGSSFLYLHNVTLRLPADEYLALAAIGLQSQQAAVCAPDAVMTRAAILSRSIQSVSAHSVDAQVVTFGRLRGWGMDATQLHVVPTSPVVMSLLCDPPDHKRCGQLSCPQLAGVIVSALAVVAAVAATALYLINRRQKRSGRPVSVSRSLESKVPGTATGGPPTDASAAPEANAARELQAVVTAEAVRGGDETSSTVPSSSRLSSPEPPQTALLELGAASSLASRLSALLLDGRSTSMPGVYERGVALEELGAAAQQEATRKVQQDWVLKQVAQAERLWRDRVAQKATQLSGGQVPQVTIKALLAQGASGSVYQGEWRGLPVAIKTVMFRHSSDNPSHTAMAIMEAAMGASLGHRNLVNTYLYDIKQLYPECEGSGDSDDVVMSGGLQISLAGEMQQAAGVGRQPVAYKLFLVQELCDSVLSVALMKRLLHDHPPPSTDWASILTILLDIARGLEYLHSKSIIHGDLKPANILLKVCSTKDGIPCVVSKLGDFGLSQQLVPGASHVSNFRSGTMFFAAPEVHTYSRLLPASDWYSFGVVMWECATGLSVSVPAKDGGWSRHPQFPHFVQPYMAAPAYELLMQRCLSVNPSHRPAAAEVIQTLDTLCQVWRGPAAAAAAAPDTAVTVAQPEEHAAVHIQL